MVVRKGGGAMSPFEKEYNEYLELALELCGTEDLSTVLQKVSQMTGWYIGQVERWSAQDLNDVMRVLLSKRVKTDHRKLRALKLWNDGLTWAEVAKIVDGSGDGHHALMQEIKYFAKANSLEIRTGTPGHIRGD